MSKKMSRIEILKNFQEHIHCSQVVLGQWAEELGYDKEACLRMAAPFAGGCGCGEVCGAVSGAMIAIGMRYGHSAPGDVESEALLQEKVTEFRERFAEKCGSIVCRELVGYDFSDPEQFRECMESGATMRKCPDYVSAALEILDEIM